MTLLVVICRHLDGSAELSSLESPQFLLYYSLLTDNPMRGLIKSCAFTTRLTLRKFGSLDGFNSVTKSLNQEILKYALVLIPRTCIVRFSLYKS